MSSAVNIQIVSMPNLAKIESFLKDVSYRETIEYSANFNTRLCIERRLRLPFLDPQTGVAQSHSQLFLDKRQRMPGFRQGQIYTYPAARWRKSRRQYLSKMYSRFPERPFQALRKEHEALVASGVNLGLSSLTSAGVGGGGGSMPNINSNSLGMSSSLTLNMLTGGGAAPAVLHSDTAHDFNGAFSLEESSSLGAAGGDTSDSKDSQQQQHHHQQQQQQSVKEEHLPKEWFYDDMDMNDVDSLEEPKSPADDEYDYDPRYGNKKRRKRRPGKRGGDSGGGGGGGGGGACGGGSSAGSSSSRRRSAAARSRITTTDALLDASLEAIESGESVPGSNGASSTGGGGILSSSLGAGATGGSGSGVGGAGGSGGAGAAGGGSGGSSSSSRRSRGAGTRGRRRVKGGAGGDPPSPGMVIEPPSFESAAAAVGVVEDANAHLRNYRKYL